MKKAAALPVLLLMLFVSGGYAEQETLLLQEAEKLALGHSHRLRAAAAEQKAFEERAYAQRAQLYPKLTLEGSYRYVTNIPEIAPAMPGASPVRLGDNPNYSIGPALSWTAWDFGGNENSYRSASAFAEAKKNDAGAVELQVLFGLRSAYFRVALSKEQVTLYSDALKLANSQYEDINLNVSAGTKSLADKLKSHQEVIGRTRQLRQAEADLEIALRDLSAAAGNDCSGVELESINSLLERFERYSGSKLNERHPALLSYMKSAESLEYSKRATGSLGLPKILVSAKTSLDYPNGPQLENINQNTFGAALSWPFFDSGASRSRSDELENAKQASLRRGEQALSDMRRDWDNTMSRLLSLKAQDELNKISVRETGQLAQITYKAYRTGSVSFIEVETANFKSLEARMQAAKTKVEILMNLAALAGMAE